MKKILKMIFSKKNIKWLLLIMIVIVVVLFFTLRKDEDVIVIKDNDLYMYSDGIKLEYSGRISINKTKDEISKIAFLNEEAELDTTPLYYSDMEKVIFPKNMSIVYPLEGTQYKINYFSEAYNEFDEVVVKDKLLKKRLFDSIIFDGKDLYFITTESKVTFSDEEIDLSRLSYVIVNTFSQTAAVYDYENDIYTTYEDITGDVIITNGKYKVNASLDLMYYGDTSRLLIKDTSKLINLPKD